MDIITTPSYEEMQTLYSKYFSLDFLGSDINNKFALISLTCYITEKIKKQKPDWTHWKTLYEINKGTVPEDLLPLAGCPADEGGIPVFPPPFPYSEETP